MKGKDIKEKPMYKAIYGIEKEFHDNLSLMALKIVKQTIESLKNAHAIARTNT